MNGYRKGERCRGRVQEVEETGSEEKKKEELGKRDWKDKERKNGGARGRCWRRKSRWRRKKEEKGELG